MASRYERVCLIEKLHNNSNTNVELLAGAILRDTLENALKCQLKFKVIGERPLYRVSVVLSCIDGDGKEIAQKIHTYINGPYEPETNYGTDVLIEIVPETVSVEVSVHSASFDSDVQVWAQEVVKELINSGYKKNYSDTIDKLKEITGLSTLEAIRIIESVFPDAYKPEKPEKTGGCYVATSVYGSYDCPQVWTLRRFRDYTLAETWYGRAFIKTYYAISPTLVKLFGQTKWFKDLWKPMLDHMVKKLNESGVEDIPYNDIEW